MAASLSAIPEKKELLKSGSGELRFTAPQLVQILKRIFDESSPDSLQETHKNISTKIGNAYKQIINAVKMEEESSFAKLRDILEAIAFMIEAGSKLQSNAGNLIKSIAENGPVSQRSGFGQATFDSAREVQQHAQTLSKIINEPVVKQVIDSSMKQIETSSQALKTLSKVANLTAAQKNEAATNYQNLIEAATRVMMATRSNAMKESPIHMTTQALNGALENLKESSNNGDVAGVRNYSKAMSQQGQAAVSSLNALANNSDDPKEKKAYLDAAQRLQEAIKVAESAATAFAANPNSPQAKSNLLKAINDVQVAIELARILEGSPAGFSPVVSSKPTADIGVVSNFSFNAFDLEPSPNDDELIRAAKEQALAAADVTREADRYKGGNSQKDLLIAEASNKVRTLAQKVVEAAKKSSLNPDDANAQAEMARYQKELAQAISTLLKLIGNDSNVSDAMQGLQEAVNSPVNDKPEDAGNSSLANDFFKIAELIIQTIKNNFKGNVKDDVNTARELAILSTKANKALQAFSNSVKAQAFKDQLLNGGKIISDNSLKLKILATVKVSGGSDDTSQVLSAAQGLKTQVEQLVSQVKAGSLRHRLQATTKQTNALKKIAQAVRKARLN